MKKLTAIILLFASMIYGQNAEWVSTQLPNGVPSSFSYSIGATCIMFADDTSSAVHAFNIYDGQWETLLAPTQNDWTDVEADGNVALAWNDEVIVGYSSLTGTFDAINYTGSLMSLSGNEAGCIDNFAFFVTDAAFFVFDASEGTWQSFGYTSPGAGVNSGGVSGKEDFIYLTLDITNSPPMTVVTYSGITKTFDQLVTEYLSNFILLDHGFVFKNYNSTPNMCFGYSAYNGLIKTKSSDEYITINSPSVGSDCVTPLICCLFISREDLGGGNSRRFFWVFNTALGDFAETTYDYDYGGTHYDPSISGCGGSFAFETVNNKDRGGIIECYLYDAQSNSFSHFDTPLYHWGSNNLNGGGSVLDGFDQSKFIFYNTETLEHQTAQTHWVDGISPGINERTSANYWSAFVYKIFNTDTIKVMSYHAPTNNLIEWEIISNLNTGSDAGPDLFWFLLGNQLHVYAPLYDKWIQYDLTNVNARKSHGNYLYLHDTALDQCIIYDAELDDEFIFPRPTSAMHYDSLYVQYYDGKYYAYSASKNDTATFTAGQYTYQYFADYIGVFATSYFDLFVYDSFTNIFLSLTLTAEQGRRRLFWPGGKTALVLTDNGYLFAYKPGIISSVENGGRNIIPETIEVSQNYPNPFNPTTTISYTLTEVSEVTLTVYDATGHWVTLLQQKTQQPGKYHLQWDGRNSSGQLVSTGVYFYRLQAGEFVDVKKMVLMK